MNKIPNKGDQLSEREREVAVTLLADKPNKQAASDLGITIKTIEKHRIAIYRKLGVHTTIQFVARAIQTGLIDDAGSWARNLIPPLLVIALCCAFSAPARRLRAPETHGAVLLMSKPSASPAKVPAAPAAVLPPPPVMFLQFNYRPGESTSFSWTRQSTTNFKDWKDEDWNGGWVTNSGIGWRFFRMKGIR